MIGDSPMLDADLAVTLGISGPGMIRRTIKSILTKMAGLGAPTPRTP